MYLIKINLILLISIIYVCTVFSQDFNIIPYLIKIEKGMEDSVIAEIEKLKNKYPFDPNIMYLNAITIKNAKESIVIFQQILDNFSQSQYADASAFRLFNYYITTGEDKIAKSYFEKLKNNYSESPYLKIAKNQFETLLKSKSVEKENEVTIPQIVSRIKYNFTIQVGAFTKKQNAIALKKQLENNGIYSEIKEKNIAGTIFNVVTVGRFQSKNDAENFLPLINSQFNIQGIVVQIGE